MAFVHLNRYALELPAIRDKSRFATNQPEAASEQSARSADPYRFRISSGLSVTKLAELKGKQGTIRA